MNVEDGSSLLSRMQLRALGLNLLAGLVILTCSRHNPISASKPGSILLQVVLADSAIISQVSPVHDKDRTPKLAKVTDLRMIVSLDGTAKVTRNVTSGAQESVTISDVAPGSHTVSVVFDDRQVTPLYSGQTTVSVSSGQQATATVNVTPVNRTAPVASFTVTPSSGPLTTTFTVDASDSKDLHDANPRISWDWGDGKISTAVRDTHQYTTRGVMTIRLTVANTNNQSSTKEQTITISNRAPIANVGPDQTVRVGTSVTLDGSGSSDPDRDKLTYQWTVDTTNPVSVTLPNPNDSMPRFTPVTPGMYRFRLVVNDGNTDSPSVQVTITVQPRSGTQIAARLDKWSGVRAGDKFTLTVGVTGASGVTGYQAEVLYDFNAVGDPAATTKLQGAVSPGTSSEAITTVPGFNRRTEAPGAQLPPNPFTGDTDLAAFEFTTKANFTTTNIGIRWLILRAGARADTLVPSPSPMVLKINP